MTHWAKAGVRATPAQIEARRRQKAQRAAEQRFAQEQALITAKRGWARGLIRPWYITVALDRKGIQGPQVDVDCGGEEPMVDLWESGDLYPTFEQLCKLAHLTGLQPVWFVKEHPQPETSIHLQATLNIPPSQPPITRFTQRALIAAGINQPNLFNKS